MTLFNRKKKKATEIKVVELNPPGKSLYIN